MKPLRLFLAAFLFVVSLAAMADDMVCDLKYYTYEDGLSHSTISGIVQDQRGLIWFGTWNGLSSFDGYQFRNYRPYPGDRCTMMNSRLNFVSVGADGDIWCINQEQKAYLFDVKRHQYLDVLEQVQADMHQVHTVSRIIPLSKGVTWVLCSDNFSFRVWDKACKSSGGISDTAVTVFGNTDRKLKGSVIYNVFQDKDQNEWVLTDKGVSIIGDKKLNNDFPFHFFIEIGKTIWLGTLDGRLARYMPNRQSIKFVSMPLDVRGINSLIQTGPNELAVCTDQGILLMDVGNGSFRHLDVRPTPGSPSMAQFVYKDSKGEFWVQGAQSGVIHIDKNGCKLLQSPPVIVPKIDGTNRFVVFEDVKKKVWVIPRDGQLAYYDRTSQVLRTPFTLIGGQQVPIAPLARNYLLDNQGNLWAGSNISLCKMSIAYRNYSAWTFRTGEAEVRAIRADRLGRIWIASKDGRVRVYDSKLNSYLCLTPEGDLKPGDAVFGHNVYDIMEDRSGNIWLGAKLYGLFLLKPVSSTHFTVQQFQSSDSDPFSLSGSSVYTIFQDSRKRIWVGTFEGGLNLLSFDPSGRIRFLNVKNQLKNFPFELVKGVRYIVEKEGKILLATTNGLVTFSVHFSDPEAIQFIRNSRRPDDVTSLSGNDIMYIFTDSRNVTYLITQNAGINEIQSADLLSDKIVFKVFNERSGLASDLTRTMIEDRFGKLWLVSKHMITRFDPKRNVIDNYGSHIFRESFMFSEASILKDSRNNILVGTSSGVFRFDPLRMVKRTYSPPIIFTGLKVQGSEIEQDANSLDKLVLKASQRNLIIQFAALDYGGTDQIRYSYRLEGVDVDWHEETTNRSAVYLNLPHGKLRFVVRSTNSDGAWVNNERSLNIIVRPTFWETPWSWMLLVLVVAGIILAVVRVLFTIFRLKHEVDMEQHLSDIKLKFFTDVSHELRTPLTLIASPINEVIENENLSDKARQHLTLVQRNVSRLLTLVNQILDFRKIQNKRMKMLVEETDVISLLKCIMENFSLISKEKDIPIKLEATMDSLMLWVDRDKFEKIIFNLLSNAFKYSQDGKFIRIRVTEESDKVRISVFDEGIGIPASRLNSIFKRFEMFAGPEWSQQSSGIGLSLVKELTELHHGSIEAFSKLNEGSEFRLSLLKGRGHFHGDEQTEFILGDGEASVSVSGCVSSSAEEEIEFTEEERKANQTILVVEDNQELLLFLKDIFSKDFKVVTAMDGKEGLEKAVGLLPDLIVSDVMMPVMDGLEMIRQIKEDKDICHIPIIILSAKDTLEDRLQGLERGIDDYITKPFSASYLRMRVKNLLNQRKSLQEAMLAAMEFSATSDSEHPLRIMPSDPKITNHDELFVQQIMEFMEANMDNTALTVDDIAIHLSMSRTVFYKKVKFLFGVTPIDLVKDIRVKRSVQLIESGMYSFSEVAYMSGFSDPNYFGKCFKKLMGVTPSKYKESLSDS